MKILIFIDHDIMIRHFALSRVFEGLLDAGHDVRLVLPENADSRIKQMPTHEQTNLPMETIKINPQRGLIWRHLFFMDKFRWSLKRDNKANKNLQAKQMGWKATLQFNVLSLPILRNWHIQKLWRKLETMPNEVLLDFLDAQKPDLIIHPTVLAGVFLDDLVYYSKRKSIPMLTVMNSWDNPSTKHSAADKPQHLLVWGHQTWNHAKKYMKMPSERLTRFGAAQFDVYYEEPLQDKAAFCASHGLDPARPVLLYAGSSKGLDEVQHLHMIEDMIDDGRLPAIQVLYRPHPWGGGGAGGGRLIDEKWRHVVLEESMVDYLRKVQDDPDTISLPDYRHTHNVLSHIDFLVSPLSTIILEAALHGKPALCFMPLDENQKEASHFHMVRELPHFEDMFASDVFPVAWGAAELQSGLQKVIDQSQDPKIRDILARECAFYVEPHQDRWRDRIVNFVDNFVATQKEQ